MTRVPLTVTHPELGVLWSPKNPERMSEVTAGSGLKPIWVCDRGHEWEAAVYSVAKGGRRCPYCAGRYPIPGETDLTTLRPDLAAQWHPTKNGALTPTQVKPKSNIKVWWVCPNNPEHEWETLIANRAVGKNCPHCSNTAKNPLNPITVTHPAHAANWDTKRNLPHTPEKFTSGSRFLAHWVGDCGHSFPREIRSYAHENHTECLYCNNIRVLTGYNDLATLYPQIAAEWHPTKNGDLTPENIIGGSDERVWWVCEKNHEWYTKVSARTRNGTGCRRCNPGKPSKGEASVTEHIQSLGFHPVTGSPDLIPPYSVDVYVPEKKLAVEFNGVYWHSEAAGRGHRYHETKYLKAKQAGIQLIQVWEDDWNRDPELIKRLITHKLGVNIQPAVYARKTRVEALTTVVARTFLTANHIQGFASGSHHLGLRDIETDVLVAVMVLKKEPGQPGALNIVRYSTSTRVPGGFTKLLKHAEREYHPEKFVTFADHCVSDGNLYEQNGFVADKILPPDYMYLVGLERKHKFGYRIKKFRNDPTLKYEEGLTEKQLAALNNLHRIWDAGKTRYTKTITQPIENTL